jgi:hypothetical protein
MSKSFSKNLFAAPTDVLDGLIESRMDSRWSSGSSNIGRSSSASASIRAPFHKALAQYEILGFLCFSQATAVRKHKVKIDDLLAFAILAFLEHNSNASGDDAGRRNVSRRHIVGVGFAPRRNKIGPRSRTMRNNQLFDLDEFYSIFRRPAPEGGSLVQVRETEVYRLDGLWFLFLSQQLPRNRVHYTQCESRTDYMPATVKAL